MFGRSGNIHLRKGRSAMSPPAVIIYLPLEAAPYVVFDYLDDGDSARVADWLDEHPAYLELVERAVRLAEEARAA
jgi:hypothetical protein